jgi:hypothetical protein
MKNGDLCVVDHDLLGLDGSFLKQVVLKQSGPAKDLNLAVFEKPEEMTDWEYAAYEAYTETRCNAENIWSLTDLFGEEFSIRFFNRKHKLLAAERIQTLLAEKEEIEKQLTRLAEIMNRPEDVVIEVSEV